MCVRMQFKWVYMKQKILIRWNQPQLSAHLKQNRIIKKTRTQSVIFCEALSKNEQTWEKKDPDKSEKWTNSLEKMFSLVAAAFHIYFFLSFVISVLSFAQHSPLFLCVSWLFFNILHTIYRSFFFYVHTKTHFVFCFELFFFLFFSFWMSN